MHDAGFNSTQVADFVPMYRPYGGFYGGLDAHFGRGGFGYTPYVPYIDTVYVHWLRMKLYTKDGTALNQANVVWLAEAVTGADTGRWVTTTIKRNDPRILALTGGEQTLAAMPRRTRDCGGWMWFPVASCARARYSMDRL